MANLAVMDFEVFKGKRILVTGHSGFKGSWLTVWLQMLGAEVMGYSDFNSNFKHHSLLSYPGGVENLEIRNFEALKSKLTSFMPDFIFHLAAQPLVSEGYKQPLDTWDINFNGTLNLLRSLDSRSNLRGVVIVTSDKVYLDNGNTSPHIETDPLGGHDPYSASKAAVEFLVASFLQGKSSWNQVIPPLVTVRAGNVIGGGDFSKDRLFPDIYSSFVEEKPLKIRMPNAVRPWQHVLDCLYGYLLLGARMLNDDLPEYRTYNFGPTENSSLRVSKIISIAQTYFALNLETGQHLNSDSFIERRELNIDSRRARQALGWSPNLTQTEAVNWTFDWYSRFVNGGQLITRQQILDYSERLDKG